MRKIGLLSLGLILFSSAGMSAQSNNAVSDETVLLVAVRCLNDETSSTEDRKVAVNKLMELAGAGYGKALNELGICYTLGNHIEFPKDCEKALAYFTKAWEANYLEAARNLAVLYRSTDCFPADKQKALEWTKKGAEAGQPDMMHDYAVYFLEGSDGQPVDSISALGWFRKSAEAGNGDALWGLSRFYHNKGNAEESRYWLKKGADKDNKFCLHGYGLYLKNGENGVPKDADTAALYFCKAADLYGFDDSAMEYGNYLDEKGRYTEAVRYFMMSANQGNIYSMTMLGDYCVAGKGGLEKSDSAAFEWYQRGFESQPRNREEFAYALYCGARVGLCYYLGKGIEQNQHKGRELLYNLAAQDFPTAIEYIRKLNIR